ncbi:septation protein SpoVG family protein [Patescibacteria group bacterium]|nr:septation protein SpoVG family protein [Patescibacteria group bacterium]
MRVLLSIRSKNGGKRQLLDCGCDPENAKKDAKGRMKLHADIAHPINAECRQRIQEKITESFKEEFEK